VSAPTYTGEYSAGGVVYRPNGSSAEIALIYRTRHDDWSLPKGHIEEGETREQAALREVKEETGIDARIIAPLGESVYFYRRKNGELIRKSVYHFLMEALSVKLGKPNWEVTEARWVPITEAQALLSYEKDKEIVAKAANKLDAKGDYRQLTTDD
jgi:8-oxo-dGTP diphosphatase